MAKIKEIKIEAKGLKQIKAEMEELKKAMRSATSPEEMNRITEAAAELRVQLQNVNDKVKDFKLDDKLKDASSAADPLAKAIEEVTNEMKDLNDASKDVGENFEKLTNEQIATELSSVAGGFTAIATSAYALSDALGITNDDTEEFVKNIGTGLAVANGFGQGIQGIISAQKLLASTTLATTTATKGGTIAMRIFNTVVKANPIGLLVTALLAAITAFAIFNSSSKDAEDNTDKLERATQRLNAALERQEKLLNARQDARKDFLALKATQEQIELEKTLLGLMDDMSTILRDNPKDYDKILSKQREINKVELQIVDHKNKSNQKQLTEEQKLNKEKQDNLKDELEGLKAKARDISYLAKISTDEQRALNDKIKDMEGELKILEVINHEKYIQQQNDTLAAKNSKDRLAVEIASEQKLADIRKNSKSNKGDDSETETVKENISYITALRDQLRDREIVAEIQHKKQLELMDADLIQDEEKRAAEILRINTKYKQDEVDALTRLNDSIFVVLDEQRKLDLIKAGDNTEEKKLIEEKFAADVSEIYRELDKEKKELEAGTVFNKVEEDAESLSDTLSNLSDIILRTAENLDSSFGEGLAAGIQGISEFIELGNMEFESGIDKVAAYAAAAASAISGILSAVQDANRKALEETLNDTEASTNEQIDLINNQIEAGVLSVEAGEDAKNELNKKSEAVMLAAKKKAFEEDKKFQIAQATIAGIQGALQAFTGAMQLGPIAGPIVGGLLAAAVAGMTVANISKIKSTKFNSGGGGKSSGVPSVKSSSSTPTRQAPVANFQGRGGTDSEQMAGGQSFTIENNVSVSETEITDKQKTVANLSHQSTI